MYEREQSMHFAISLRVGRSDVRLLFLTLTLNLLQLHFIDLSFEDAGARDQKPALFKAGNVKFGLIRHRENRSTAD